MCANIGGNCMGDMAITLADAGAIANIAGGLSTLIALVLATIGAKIAYSQIVENREAAALDAFLEYMKTILDNSHFDQPDFQSISQDKSDYIKYKRFVAYALTACERIFLYSKGQRYWLNTVQSHVNRHCDYILTDDFSHYIPHYSPEMCAIFNEFRTARGASFVARSQRSEEVGTDPSASPHNPDAIAA